MHHFFSVKQVSSREVQGYITTKNDLMAGLSFSWTKLQENVCSWALETHLDCYDAVLLAKMMQEFLWTAL